MAQSAIFIDAGFLIHAGGTVVTGTSLRSAILVDFPKLIAGIVEATRENCGLEPLRVYWYDASYGGLTDEHRRIAMLEDVKVRLGRINYDGTQKGVDVRLGLDLVEVARTGAAQVAYLVSGDDDLTEAVVAAQDLGMKVALVGIEDKQSRIGVMSVAEHLAMQADRIVRLERGFIEKVITARPRVAVNTGQIPVTPAVFTGGFAGSGADPSEKVNTAEDIAGKQTSSISAHAGPSPKDMVTKVQYGNGKHYHGRNSDLYPIVYGVTRDLTELSKVAFEVGESVAAKWLEGATQLELNELLEYRPTLPGEIDRVLLRDCAARVGEQDTDIQFVRRQLRQAFWERIEEV